MFFGVKCRSVQCCGSSFCGADFWRLLYESTYIFNEFCKNES